MRNEKTNISKRALPTQMAHLGARRLPYPEDTSFPTSTPPLGVGDF